MANAPAVTPILSVTASADISDIFLELSQLLEQNAARIGEPAVQAQIGEWRLRAAASFSHATRAKATEAELEAAAQIQRELAASGVNDYAVDATLVERAKEYADKGASGILSATMLLPAWQWQAGPRLRDVPPALMPVYAVYQFAPVRLLTSPNQAEVAARKRIAALQDLAALLEANRGSSAARGVLEAYRTQEQPDESALPVAVRLELRAAHARLLAALNRVPSQNEPMLMPREGRKLRVGVVGSVLDNSRLSFELLSIVDALDQSRFELVLCTESPSESVVEKRLEAGGATRVSLAGTTDDMAQAIRDAFIDVAVFVVNEPWTKSPIAPLALYRVAAVQVWHDGTGLPSTLAQADLFLTGRALSLPPGRVGERAALLHGVGAIALNNLETGDVEADWSRASLGFTEQDLVFTSVTVRLREITLEIQETYAELLARVPQARLLVAATGDDADTTCVSERFCVQFASLLHRRGVDASRVRIFSDLHLKSHEDLKKCMTVTDVVLAPDRAAMPEALIVALQSKRPIVAWRWSEPDSSRAAALLKMVAINELSVDAPSAFIETAAKLAQDSDARTAIQGRLNDAGSAVFAAHDAYAQSESFGRAVEMAFDEVMANRRSFRANRAPIQAAAPASIDVTLQEAQFFLELGSGTDAEARARALLVEDPASPNYRKLLVSALLLQGRDGEATDVAVTVVELAPNDWSAWHSLAKAARKARRHQIAVQALETALRIDSKQVESWLLLAEIAQQVGNQEMYREVASILQQLAPEDSRVIEIAQHLSS